MEELPPDFRIPMLIATCLVAIARWLYLRSLRRRLAEAREYSGKGKL